MIKFKHKGNFKKLNNFLEKSLEKIDMGVLNEYGRKGVEMLNIYTPKKTGRTANSWDYSIERSNGVTSLNFHNTNIQNGVLVAILLQYDHATGTGGFVKGVDYINPALKPIFDELAEKVYKEATR